MHVVLIFSLILHTVGGNLLAFKHSNFCCFKSFEPFFNNNDNNLATHYSAITYSKKIITLIYPHQLCHFRIQSFTLITLIVCSCIFLFVSVSPLLLADAFVRHAPRNHILVVSLLCSLIFMKRE